MVLCWVAGLGLKAEWTQLSEAASLPMSKKYRDDLREKLARLDVGKLGETDRAKIRKIQRMLDGPEDQQEGDKIEFKSNTWLVLVVAGVGGIAFWWKKKNKRESLPGPSQDDLRDARLKKYE